MHTPLPGDRRAVIGDVAEALRLAADGVGPHTLVLTAGPGTGKTHTLHTMTASLDLTVRRAVADELSWRRPYAVAASLMDVPLPATVPPGFSDTLDAALDALTDHGPHLLVVDDVHNADSGSLEFLGELAAAARDLPLVLLLARRHLPARDLLTRLLTRPWVREWQLPLMDAADLGALTHDLVGGWPDERLSDLLARSGGNPLHARAILDELRSSDRLTVADGCAGVDDIAVVEAQTSLHTAVGQQLALLDERSRALVQKLAVWGSPAGLEELAALDGVAPSTLVGTAQTAIDAGIIVASDNGTMAFAHDMYADVAYDGLDPSLRRVLHSAIGRHHEHAGHHQIATHHLLASGPDTATAAAAINRAHQELTQVPAVAVDLLATAASTESAPPSRTLDLDLDLATALARSGQLARAAEAAQRGLTHSADPVTVAQLHQILLFTLIAQGKSDQALELIDSTLQLPVDPSTRSALLGLQRYVRMLGGTEPLPHRPHPLDGAGTVGELVTEALRRFLAGDGGGGLELALEASRREADADDGADRSTSADIWPPFIEQYVHGPAAAEDLLDHAISRRADRGVAWMTAYHDFTRAGIALARGRLTDAEASVDAGLERAVAGDLGWTSLAEGTRALVDVYRGRFSPAATRLNRFAESGLPDQFGIPLPAHARMLLLEMQRKLRPANEVAYECWTRTTDLALDGWLPSLAVDCARIAHRTADAELAHTVAAGLAGLPTPLTDAARGPVALALALCTGAPETIIEAATRTATAAADLDERIAEAEAWEEAACAAAALGDKSSAREHAHRALLLSQGMGAVALSRRITSRLRAFGLRMDARTVRDRPQTGWHSLTRTEATIAELVAEGCNSAEIAQQLYISPRTVQTHVSHALRKLGLRTRVELAALVVTRRRTRATDR